MKISNTLKAPLILIGLFLFGLTLLIFHYPANSEIIKPKIGHISENISLTLPSYLTSRLFTIDPKHFQSPKEYLSDIKKPNFEFSALIAEWIEETPANTEVQFFMRFFENQKWSDFTLITSDSDGDGRLNLSSPNKKAFIGTNLATAFQYKIILTSSDASASPRFSNLTFTYLRSKSSDRQSTSPAIFSDWVSSLRLITNNKPRIISRKTWGADESIRYYHGDENPLELLLSSDPEFREKYKDEIKLSKVVENDEQGNIYTWPLEYAAEIKKIVIHHTATTGDLNNPAEAIRNIYYYHTISRGFGDIGYNYIIDPQGRIYEGRYGGNKVVGAHAIRYNHGSIGIALLGDYTTREPSFEMIQSLLNLVNYLGEKYQIDPFKSSKFRGEMLPNILGHRDVGETTCPGHKVYEKLKILKKMLSAAKSDTIEKTETEKKPFNFYETSVRRVLLVKPERTQTETITLKNTGTETWDSKTYLLANQNPDNDGKIIFLRPKDNPLSIANLKESSVPPDQTGSFDLTLTGGLKSGIINFEITPFFNGKIKTSQILLLPAYIKSPNFDYEFVSASFPEKPIKKGQAISAWIELRNTGDITWRKSGPYPIHLGTDSPKDHPSIFLPDKGNRPGILVQEEVPPGQVGRFNLNLTAPKFGGHYEEKITPVMESLTWFADQNITIPINVKGDKYQIQFITVTPEVNFRPGETHSVWLQIKNSGDAILSRAGANAISTRLIKKTDVKVSDVKLRSDIKPGEVGWLDFQITAPKTPGNYQILLWPSASHRRLTKKPLFYKFQVLDETPVTAQSDDLISQGGPIRIKLSFNGEPIITGNGQFKLVVAGKDIETFNVGNEVSVNFSEGLYIVKTPSHALTFGTYPRFEPLNGTIMQISSWDRHPSWDSSIKENQFRGILEVRLDAEQLITINELALEEYLQGLSEESNDTLIEKQKAIIVAARSYARHYQQNNAKFPGKPYHGSDDPAIFQKYTGYSYEIRNPNVVNAVKATRGEVVTYQGQLVKTPYFSQSDGRTRSSKEVWGKEVPYLQSVPDPYCENLTLLGHGVGMSGCGSSAAAKNGKTYQEILKYYYQGVEIKKIY